MEPFDQKKNTEIYLKKIKPFLHPFNLIYIVAFALFIIILDIIFIILQKKYMEKRRKFDSLNSFGVY